MPHHPNLLFVLTDGGHARLVERSPDNGHYLTLEELDGGPQLRALREALRSSPPTRSISSTSPRRSAMGPEDSVRPAKEAFIGEVARRAAELCRQRRLAGVVVAAPPRLIGLLRASFDKEVVVAGAIRKDLTKAPNSRLGAWLNEVFTHPLAGAERR